MLEIFHPSTNFASSPVSPRAAAAPKFHGYEVRRRESNEIEVVVTHHKVADQLVVCTADFPIVEANVPLGSGFEPGEEYTARVNSDTATSFVAQ